MKAAYRFICIVLAISFLAAPAWARECELYFQTPKKVVHEGRNYVVWSYQIKNNTDKVISVPVEVFLATDTGGMYHDRYQPEIEPLVEEKGKRYENAFTMAGEFQPHQTKKALAYFENVDENARVLYIYISGLSHFFFWRWRLIEYSYRVVYRRSGESWELVEHGFSKDTTHRDYDSWKDTYARGGPSTQSLIHAPDVRFQYEAPRGPGGERQKMIEDFIGVFDAIFNADKIRNPKKAIALWEAITDRRDYREVDLKRPQKVYTWEEAWEKNKRLIDQTHARMTGGPFEKPTEALWKVSKIDGYKELQDGVLEVYVRYAMFYKKEYHYGLAIFKIKNTLPYRPIPSWKQYPYKSRWKIFDYRWKHISKPEYNKKLFAGYPKVKW